MADNKKYYYLKLKEGFFESDEMLLIESMPDGYLYSNILLKLYLKSLKNDGKLVFRGFIPYTPQALASIVRHPVGIVEKALDTFRSMGLIDVLDNGEIYMLDIQNFIGQSSTEADRQREYYKRINGKKQALLSEHGEDCKESCKEPCKKPNKESCKESVLEIRDKRLEIRDKRIEGKPDGERPAPYEQIKELYNSICTSLPKCTAMSDARKKAVKARFASGYTLEDFKRLFEKTESSSFLKGSNAKNWRATFDWLVKDANMAKVLDGNYDDRGADGLPTGAKPGVDRMQSRKKVPVFEASDDD